MHKIINKKNWANLILLIFPIIIIFTISINYYYTEMIKLGTVSYFTLIIINSPYFVFLVLYIYVFFIQKKEYSLFALVIGIGELIALQVPQITREISYDLFVKLYSELHVTILTCVGTIFIYLLLLLQFIKSKKG